jgi:cytochrome c biogenesis protein CcmG, thiol:disulfide interchange protein DsbE
MGHRSASLLRFAATCGLLALVVIVSLDIWSQAGAPKAASGVTAPDFRLRRLDGSGSLALSRLRGRVVVLNFFASWCDPCRGEAPVLRGLSERYRNRGVVVVGVATNDDLGDARRFAQEHGLSYPLVVADEDILTAYAVRGLPETVFIDAAGSVSGRPIAGPLTTKLAQRRVAHALQVAAT